MVALSGLWLPILVATAVVWIASAIVWTVLPHHKSDFAKIEDETIAAEKARLADIGAA